MEGNVTPGVLLNPHADEIYPVPSARRVSLINQNTFYHSKKLTEP